MLTFIEVLGICRSNSQERWLIHRTKWEETHRSLPMSITACNVSEDMMEGTRKRDLLYDCEDTGRPFKRNSNLGEFGLKALDPYYPCQTIQFVYIVWTGAGSG